MLRGIIYILIATFAFSWLNLFAKYLSGFHPLQVVFFRALGTFIFIFPYMISKRIPIIGNNPGWLSLRALLGFLSLAIFFAVVQRVPLGPAVSIRYIAPVFGVLLATYFLKERVKIGQWISFLIAIIGVVILKGVDIRIDQFSFLLALLSAALLGGVFTLIRYLGSREHALTIINYFMVICLMGSLISIPSWRMPIGNEWFWMGGIGICGLIGQVFMTRAFQLAETNTIAPFKYMELVYALLMAWLFLDEKNGFYALIGMVLIIIGMVLNVYFKGKGHQKKH